MPWEGMPKHLAKGQFLDFLANRYNNNPDIAAAALRGLRQKNTSGGWAFDLVDVGSMDAKGNVTLPGGTTMTVAQNKAHLNQHWFGKGAGSQNANTTGWWNGWKGDAEGVMRQTLIRALEVSLGVEHGRDPVPANRTRHLPLDFYWVCGVPRLESYISWNSNQVTVVVITPGFGAPNLQFQVEDRPSDAAGTLAQWLQKMAAGILFVGQNLPSQRARQTTNSGAVRMANSIVVHHLDELDGGIGSYP